MVARLVRDQKVAGSNPVTSTTFDRVCENKSGFFVLIIWSIRTQADMPLFGFNRMTTGKGGLMEFRVWFWGVFSVRDVHGQKRVEKGRQRKKHDSWPSRRSDVRLASVGGLKEPQGQKVVISQDTKGQGKTSVRL